MSDDNSPWGQSAAPRPRRPPARLGLWLCLLLALAALVQALAHAFPEAVRTSQDWARVGYGAGLVALIGAGMVRGGRAFRTQQLRHAAIWALIVAGLALGFSYREAFGGIVQHLRLAFSDGTPVVTGARELVVPQDGQGAFFVVGEVNGQRVRFMVDTGASDTVLSPDDARRLGVDVDRLQYVQAGETANGVGYGAAFAARRLQVGPVGFDDFKMVVNRTPLSNSLLGESFLDRLESFEVQDHKLILRWRDPAAASR